MATGRYGGHRYNEFRDREVLIKFSGRRDCFHSRCRNGSSAVDFEYRNNGTEELVKAREALNGAHRKNVRYQSGSRRSGLVLSYPSELENEVPNQPSKKRKFPPILRDRDEIKKTPRSDAPRIEKEKMAVVAPLTQQSHSKELGVSDSIKVVQHSEEQSPSMARKVSLYCPEDHLHNCLGSRQMEEEEEDANVTARNISTSRWADGNDAMEDEGEVLDDVGMAKRRRNHLSATFADEQLASSSDLGEAITKEGCTGNASNNCNSGADRVGHLKKSGSLDGDDNNGEEDLAGQSSTSDSEAVENGVRTPEPTLSPQRSRNTLCGCRSVDEFQKINKINEGTYGVVYKARDKKTGEIVALKKVKMEKETEGFPLVALREVNILISFHHPSIVDVKEVVVGSNLDHIFIVMEYMEHDLKGFTQTMKHPFSQSDVKCLMLQLLAGVKHLHDNWVLHRDLKTSNLLLNNCGELKICDFGLSRHYASPLKPYTPLVVTLWYRAPELLLGAKEYSTAIDMWSVGCIMAELLANEPLFTGKTELDQLEKIFRTLGTPNENIWPGFSKLPGFRINFIKQQRNKLREKFRPTSFSGCPVLSEAGLDLLNKLLAYDPEERITAEAALDHAWFGEVPLPKSKEFLPTFPVRPSSTDVFGAICSKVSAEQGYLLIK